MIISEKCNCCAHEDVCRFKEEYRNACEAIKNASYSSGKCSVSVVKDTSLLSVSIKCAHALSHKHTTREVLSNEKPEAMPGLR